MSTNGSSKERKNGLGSSHGKRPRTLRFWVDCSYEDRKHENASRTRAELIAEILCEYERSGDAMRYLNVNGQIAWKASPWLLARLADAEREVEDDMEGLP